MDDKHLTTDQGMPVTIIKISLTIATGSGTATGCSSHWARRLILTGNASRAGCPCQASGSTRLLPNLQEYEALHQGEILQNTNKRLPFCSFFLTVSGGRGSADTVRDARGFAVKFYTRMVTTIWWECKPPDIFSFVMYQSPWICSRKNFKG